MYKLIFNMQPITSDILRQGKRNHESFLFQPKYVQEIEELKKNFKGKPDIQTNNNLITQNMIKNINKILEIDNIINNTINSIYNYMNFNAHANTDKFKDFNIISADSYNFDQLIHNSYNEEILTRLKILFPEFKITLRYWMIMYISKHRYNFWCNSRHLKSLAYEGHIELNADGSRITPINIFTEYFTFGDREIKYYNSILIDWSEIVI